jgi:alanine racemase
MTTGPTICIDHNEVRRAAIRIRRQTGVEVLAVVKANAYGLGVDGVVEAIGDCVDGFYVLDLQEAMDARLWDRTGKPAIALLGASNDPKDWLKAHVRPAVWDVERARQLREARPVLAVDTGQQRFACSLNQVADVIRAGAIDEAFTHATTLQQVNQLVEAVSPRGMKLHAAGTALLHEQSAWLDAVRPGLALYESAVRVSARLLEVRDSHGPAGYSGFIAERFGVIRMGYTNGLRKGPCLVNGQRSHVLEVGMQSAFVEVSASTKAGDEVVLLGDGITPQALAAEWKTSPQEVLVQMTRSLQAQT